MTIIPMDKFYNRFTGTPKTNIILEEILPAERTEEAIRKRAVYVSYVRKISGNRLDHTLRPFRLKSLGGELESDDFRKMNDLLGDVGSETKYDAYLLPANKESSKFYAYANVKTCCMLLAQILFVNHAVHEGLPDRIEEKSKTRILESLPQYINKCAEENLSPVNDGDSRFYAFLFLLQTAFDKLFVPDDDIVTYDLSTGAYHVSEAYHACTSYLEFANKKVITATTEEKELCYQITTGWSREIDPSTWDRLNEYYYGAISPTTGEENLFTKHYDGILEKMLPQFGRARVRLSETVLKEKKGAPLKIVEIGAGSGAFAIDLIMACQRLGIPVHELEYLGIDPSQYMRDHFTENIQRKIGRSALPDHWRLLDGSLEEVCAAPDRYLNQDNNTVVVISYCIHHCYPGSVHEFFSHPRIKERVKAVFVLDGVKEHGWTKPYYMWADCESPENFDNVTVRGIWNSETVWIEPDRPMEGHCVTRAWCSLRKLT